MRTTHQYCFTSNRTGDFERVSIYSNTRVYHVVSGVPKPKKNISKTQRLDSIARLRMRVYDIVQGAKTRYERPVFVTLTYTIPQADIDQSLSQMRLFLKRVYRKNQSRSLSVNQLQFIGVAEWQTERKSIHYHFIFFNLKGSVIDECMQVTKQRKKEYYFAKLRGDKNFVSEKKHVLDKKWGLGFVDVRNAYETEKNQRVENLASYISKYLLKDNIRLAGSSPIYASRGLERPKKTVSNCCPILPNCDIIDKTVFNTKACTVERLQYRYEK